MEEKYKKIKEDHELLKKFFYEVRNHSAEKSHRIDDLEDNVKAYKKSNKELFRLLKKQGQYIDYLQDMLERSKNL